MGERQFGTDRSLTVSHAALDSGIGCPLESWSRPRVAVAVAKQGCRGSGVCRLMGRARMRPNPVACQFQYCCLESVGGNLGQPGMHRAGYPPPFAKTVLVHRRLHSPWRDRPMTGDSTFVTHRGDPMRHQTLRGTPNREWGSGGVSRTPPRITADPGRLLLYTAAPIRPIPLRCIRRRISGPRSWCRSDR